MTTRTKGEETMTTPIIFRDIPRPERDLIELLTKVGVADLHDEMNPSQRCECLMSASMRPRGSGAKLVGPAITALNIPGDNLMMHTAEHLAQPGDVVVVSNGGFAFGALWGANVSYQAMGKHLAGAVIDGPVRDTPTLAGLALPVFSTSISPSKPGKGVLGSVNTPMLCDGVRVTPGDIVVADADGVLVLPRSGARRLAEAAYARIERDHGRRDAFLEGRTSFELTGMADTLATLGAVIEDGMWLGA
jgi:4-hydroxy-4-methyl-2-oxoglutarate aldolase